MPEKRNIMGRVRRIQWFMGVPKYSVTVARQMYTSQTCMAMCPAPTGGAPEKSVGPETVRNRRSRRSPEAEAFGA